MGLKGHGHSICLYKYKLDWMGPQNFYAYSDLIVTQNVKHYRARLECTICINQGILPGTNGENIYAIPIM